MRSQYIRVTTVGIVIFACIAAWAFHAGRRKPVLDPSPFVAYSLKQAEAQLHANPNATGPVRNLGGITRLAGLVYDRLNKELIVVGQVVKGERGITVDDLVVALRARLAANQWPLVSIDKALSTRVTGKQTIRFEGGIAGSAYAMDLLLADILLKKLGLGLTVPTGSGLRSYIDMSADDTRAGAELSNVSTRFWFVPIKAAIASREDVFAIQELEIGVHAQVMSGTAVTRAGVAIGDPAGERFSKLLTDRYGALCARAPEVRRLKSLFDLAGLAEGIRTLPGRPNMNFWLSGYALPGVPTPTEQPLLKRSISVDTKYGSRTMTVDGGIELRALVSNLRGGDVTALRDLVLKSKPSANSLVWNVPLSGWNIPGAPPVPASQVNNEVQRGTDRLGAYLSKSFGDKVSAAVSFGAIVAPYLPLNSAAAQVRFPANLSIKQPGGVSFSTSLTSDGRGGADLRDQVRHARSGTQYFPHNEETKR